MAIFVEGKCCPLCGQPMLRSQRLISFSPFVANPDDPVYPMDDATVHEECLVTHPAGQEAILQEQRSKERINLRCAICGHELTRPEGDPRPDYKYFDEEITGLGHLVYSPLSPAFEFNNTVFHRKCISEWPEKNRLRNALESLRKVAYWKESSVDYFLKDLGFK